MENSDFDTDIKVESFTMEVGKATVVWVVDESNWYKTRILMNPKGILLGMIIRPCFIWDYASMYREMFWGFV